VALEAGVREDRPDVPGEIDLLPGPEAGRDEEQRERERRHASLELTELSPESKARYQAAWEEVQIQFVDNPSEAVGTADELVTRLIEERGYPTGEYDERLADLSVEHAATLQHYRDAHEISERNAGGTASTEDLRQALVHYRVLFADLLGTEPVSTNGATTTTVRESDHSTVPESDHSTVPESDQPAPAPRTAAEAESTDAAPDKSR
jgi:hypothetical protein